MEQIPLPLNHLYDSYEEAYSSLKAHGIQHGYGFVLKRSKPHNSNVKTRYYFHCDRFRNYQSSAKKLNTSTRSTGCPFRLVIFKMEHNNQWKLEVQDKNHNHSRSTNPSTHNVYRRRTSVQKDMIESMTHAGARPMQILAAIQREDQNTLVSATDIRSERKKIREKNLNGKSRKKVLIDDLSTEDCVFAVNEDNSRIQALFIEQLSSSPLQSLPEPLTAQTRGAPRKNEASTHQGLSALEGDELCFTRSQPYLQTQSQTLDKTPHQVHISATVSTPTSGLNADAVTASIPVSIPAHTPLPPSTSLRSSPPVTVAMSAAMTPSPIWQPPSLEDFLADIESRKFQPVLYQCNDMISATNFLADTGQESDPAELVEARNMALATHGLFESCTPTMAWNYHFGDMEAFEAERFAQVDAQNAPTSRPKRAAAMAAPEAWRSLGLRKRRRCA